VLPALDTSGAALPAAPLPAARIPARATDNANALFEEAEVTAPQPNYWPYFTAAAIAAWLLTTLAWWRGRGRVAPALPASAHANEHATNAKLVRSAVHAACASRDPKQLRDALLQWAAWNWHDAPPRNILDLAARARDASLQDFLLRLEREGYAAQTEALDIKAMSAAIVNWVDADPTKESKRKDEAGLRALYPK
jgi:hypothetical protein